MKTVVKKYTNGQNRVIKLGEESTCASAEPRGWGTPCETLVFKSDGYYHCDDCGLVFKKPILKNKSDVVKIECSCKNLTNLLDWYFNKCFGYDCSSGYYKCKECKRVYKAPHYSREAPLKFQESEATKDHVKRHRKYDKEEREKRIHRAEEDLKNLKTELNRLPRNVKRRLLKALRS